MGKHRTKVAAKRAINAGIPVSIGNPAQPAPVIVQQPGGQMAQPGGPGNTTIVNSLPGTQPGMMGQQGGMMGQQGGMMGQQAVPMGQQAVPLQQEPMPTQSKHRTKVAVKRAINAGIPVSIGNQPGTMAGGAPMATGAPLTTKAHSSAY